MHSTRLFRTSMVLALGLMLGHTTSLSAQDVHAHNWGKSKDVKAQAHIEMGDELLGSHEYARARGEYESAVEILRARDEFASPALSLLNLIECHSLIKMFSELLSELGKFIALHRDQYIPFVGFDMILYDPPAGMVH